MCLSNIKEERSVKIYNLALNAFTLLQKISALNGLNYCSTFKEIKTGPLHRQMDLYKRGDTKFSHTKKKKNLCPSGY